jgi:hypothetical protein
MRIFKIMGNKTQVITEREFKAVKLAKENAIKKIEIAYTDTFINKLKQILGNQTGSDKKIIEAFIKELTKDQ